MLLDNGEGATEDVGEGARFTGRTRFQVNSDDQFGAKQERALDGHERGQEPIDEHAPLMFHRDEQTGISTRSA